MRLNRNRLLAAGVLPLLLVAGCGSGDSGGSASPSASSTPGGSASAPSGGATQASDSPLTDLVVKSKGKNGPQVSLKHKPFSVSQTETKVVSPGDGEKVTKAQTLTVDYLVVNGSNGKQLESNYGKSAATLDLAAKGLFPGLVKGLPGQKVGSKVVVAIPPADAFGSNGNSQLGIGPNDTLLFYVDIQKATTPLKSAQGTAVKPKPGLPKVKVTADKPASFTIPKHAAPKKLVVQPLIKGKGAEVKPGQQVTVNYTGVLWRNGKVFDSSIGREPFTFQVGAQPRQVIAGWDKAVQGQPVGSRLLVVVPPDEGYGKKGQGPIKGTDTMVFVVDLLAAS
ncbi:FKBP-type peptidyl-prolyl cis-trans isomerase [Segeticoccus rhizosphaerae]|uniref:FKBP-type peptidyl-prolyl cis-trans isomerase n=1 Tax=Segeticoccus rhizosphaerae TaxID=1104777 RepID=UPI0010BFFDA5|nr:MULTISPECIES: FKBP-type peptidyl-prolyl cis-trans isomerase [Intrasporangiaceae]